MAVVMPHGVLFRGGEERACRQRFIKDGILEAVIGLPRNLFYGTGIPACMLVSTSTGPATARTVLFINADREYREGKNQNSLRPEHIEKITQVYRTGDGREIRPPRAGGANWSGRLQPQHPPLRRQLPAARTAGRSGTPARRRPAGRDRRPRRLLRQLRRGQGLAIPGPGRPLRRLRRGRRVQGRHRAAGRVGPGVAGQARCLPRGHRRLVAKNVAEIERLPETKNVFDLRRHCIDSLAKALVPQGVLNVHQVRGAVASYVKALEGELKSVAASGWGAELIPEEQILQSQFPEVLAQIEKDQARIAELEGLFAAANEVEDEDADLETWTPKTACCRSALVKALKEERKLLAGEVKDAKKRMKERRKNKGAGTVEDAHDEAEGRAQWERMQEIDRRLARHSALDGELKTLKANIRESEKRKDDLIASARARIGEEEAKRLILGRFRRLLTEQFDGYLRQYQRAFVAAVENLWQKYAVTTKQILAERDREAAQLHAFLKELGYE